VVEHRIARMVQLGARKTRYFGGAKTLFQALIAATVANLTLIASKMGQMEGSDRCLSDRFSFLSAAFATIQRLFHPLTSFRPPLVGVLG
jgi:hypothetical protein